MTGDRRFDDLPLEPSIPWSSPSSDPNDETFGDVVAGVGRDGLDGADGDRGGALGAADALDATDALDAADAVLVGEPFDVAVVGREGAAEGPDAIRTSLMGAKTRHLARGPVGGGGPSERGGSPAPAVVDAGDVAVDVVAAPTVADVRGAAGAVAAAVHASDATPVFLGGDNSLSVPNVRGLLETVPDGETVGVVNCDAHLDVREVRDGPTSGTPYRELLASGLDEYVVVGARDFETSTAYVDFLAERGGTVVSADAVGADPDAALDRVAAAIASVDHLYLSVDCDVLDATAAPGVSAPTPGGLATRELFRFVGALAADDRLRGVEVVECAPPLDGGGRTADAAARTVAHALTGIVGEGAGGGGVRDGGPVGVDGGPAGPRRGGDRR